MNLESQPRARPQTGHELEMALVERAKRDPQAFGELYEAWLSPIYRFVYTRVRDEAAAEDLTAEVFINALRGIGRYRDLGKPLRAWLFQVAANTVADHQRRVRHHEVLEAQYALAARGPELDDLVADRDELRALLDQLPRAQRAALLLHCRDGLPYTAIAARLGRSPGAVKLLIHRGRSAARKRLRSGQSTDLDTVAAGRRSPEPPLFEGRRAAERQVPRIGRRALAALAPRR